MELLVVANGSSQLHNMYLSRYMAKNSWWWAERPPETWRVVVPIKLEFSASVGFIHKEAERCISNVGYMYYLNVLYAILQTSPALMFIFGWYKSHVTNNITILLYVKIFFALYLKGLPNHQEQKLNSPAAFTVKPQ